MNKINITNWLLTRKCNLKCEYCRIVKNYDNQPKEYPPMSWYYKNEMDTETVIKGLEKIKLHNPDCFHIFYGGEPLLRPDLPDIINYCNNSKINYTIISNNTPEIQPLMKNLEYIEGFTASIDPIIFDKKYYLTDMFKKSMEGMDKLKEYSGKIKDLVAEITVTNENIKYLYTLLEVLTNSGINSDITFIDISKSKYYDFSCIEDTNLLVNKTQDVKNIIETIINSNLNVHMKDTLLLKIYDILPSELDCGIEKDFHNMTIDADGSLRLCLRCRAIETPNKFNIKNILDDNGNLNKNIAEVITRDKKNYCKGCGWTCMIMSKMISDEQENSKNLVHEEIRKN